MVSSLLLVQTLGILVLGFAAYEDHKYRAVTPLPLFVYTVFAIGMSIYHTRDFWWVWAVGITFAVLYLISSTHALIAPDGCPIIAEGDAWLLTAAMAGTYDSAGVILFWFFLAFAEIGLRLGMIVKSRSVLKALDARAPLAPSVFTAFVAVAVILAVMGGYL